jgi:hypothetical protein
MGGRLETLKVQKGQSVNEGDPLFMLERDLELKEAIGVKVDLFRFDAATKEFVFEQTILESSSVLVTCNQEYLGTAEWVYDRKAAAGTYKIILEATIYPGESQESFTVASDLFVVWKSPGAPKGHAKRDLKKMDQVEKLITRLNAFYQIYEAAKNAGLIVGDELVVIHEETMTVDEAIELAETFETNAILNSDEAIAYFDAQDYETCFSLAKTAAREAHKALTIYHALLAQAKDVI